MNPRSAERRITVFEARAAALEELVPRSLQVLRVHLGDGDQVNPNAWRAALRVFEHAFGRPREEPEQTVVDDDWDLQSLSWSELEALRRRLMAENPEVGGATPPPRARGQAMGPGGAHIIR